MYRCGELLLLVLQLANDVNDDIFFVAMALERVRPFKTERLIERTAELRRRVGGVHHPRNTIDELMELIVVIIYGIVLLLLQIHVAAPRFR